MKQFDETKWEEEKHSRDKNGRFAKKGTSQAKDPKQEKALKKIQQQIDNLEAYKKSSPDEFEEFGYGAELEKLKKKADKLNGVTPAKKPKKKAEPKAKPEPKKKVEPKAEPKPIKTEDLIGWIEPSPEMVEAIHKENAGKIPTVIALDFNMNCWANVGEDKDVWYKCLPSGVPLEPTETKTTSKIVDIVKGKIGTIPASKINTNQKVDEAIKKQVKLGLLDTPKHLLAVDGKFWLYTGFGKVSQCDAFGKVLLDNIVEKDLDSFDGQPCRVFTALEEQKEEPKPEPKPEQKKQVKKEKKQYAKAIQLTGDDIKRTLKGIMRPVTKDDLLHTLLKADNSKRLEYVADGTPYTCINGVNVNLLTGETGFPKFNDSSDIMMYEQTGFRTIQDSVLSAMLKSAKYGVLPVRGEDGVPIRATMKKFADGLAKKTGFVVMSGGGHIATKIPIDQVDSLGATYTQNGKDIYLSYQADETVAKTTQFSDYEVKQDGSYHALSIVPKSSTSSVGGKCARWYTKRGDELMNGCMRGLVMNMDAEVADKATTLVKYLGSDKAKLSEPITVYRGVSAGVLERMFPDGINTAADLKPGVILTENAFMSTSLASSSAFSKSFRMIISVPTGAHGRYVGDISHYGHAEKEYLMQAGTSLQIDEISGSTIKCRVIAQDPKSALGNIVDNMKKTYGLEVTEEGVKKSLPQGTQPSSHMNVYYY